MLEILFQGISLVGLGFLLGLRHALDADHIVAVSSLVSQTRNLKHSSLLGAVWGLGHTFTLLLVGSVVLAFHLTIADEFAASFEIVVGAVLVLLGIDVIRKAKEEKVHFHAHNHAGQRRHVHFHSHKLSSRHNHVHKSFFVGMMHGLAGSAALVIFLLATVKSFIQGVSFILIFGVGSIVGMVFAGGVVGLPFLLLRNFVSVQRGVKLTMGLVSIMLGATLIYKIVFVSGVFL